MSNCKEDFLREIEGHDLLCAEITSGAEYLPDEDRKIFRLTIGFSENEYQLFLKCINYEYDSGYGGQEVYGTIWYKDGTWSERGEYDGSEWWEYKACPDVPSYLTGKEAAND